MSGSNSNPGFVSGVIPSTTQWNGYFTDKVDASGGYATNLTITAGTIDGVPTSRIVAGLGQAPAGYLFGNPGASPADGEFLSLSAYLDAVAGSEIGALLCRTTTGWLSLAPGTAGNVLVSGGTLSDLAWNTIAAALGYTPANRAGDTFAGLVGFTIAATVSAAGTTQGTATALTHQTNIITTASAGEGVIHAAAQGIEIKLMNRSGVTVLVYPPSGVQWEAYGADAPVSLADGDNLHTIVTSSTQGRVS